MSTNVYKVEEAWHYEKKPTTYYGWGITGSSYVMHAVYFKSRRPCNEIEKCMRAILPTNVDAQMIAACLLIEQTSGENPGDVETAKTVFDEEFERAGTTCPDELRDKLEKIVDDYCSKAT